MVQNLKPEERIGNLFQQYSQRLPDQIIKLPPSGSYRQYYRIISNGQSTIGAYNEDRAENIAFLSFTKHFYKKGLPVPQPLSEDLDNNVYLIQDLGDTTLLNYIQNLNYPREIHTSIVDTYKQILQQLPINLQD